MGIPVPHVRDIDLAGGHIAGFAAGYGESLWILIGLGEPDNDWFERKEPCDWRVVAIAQDYACEYVVPAQRRNFDLVQPIPNGLVLATSRCKYADTETLPNACVFDLDRSLTADLLLGDGIQHLQTTSSGEIWAAYFDEGVFGNLGWHNPIGRSGLVRFDARGNRTFEFQPTAGLDWIADCYALNVVDDSTVFLCYYTDFPIVKLRASLVARHWTNPVGGANTLAVLGETVLMGGGYGGLEWTRLKLGTNEAAKIEDRFELVTPDREPLRSTSASARGSVVWFVQNERAFRFDLRQAVL